MFHAVIAAYGQLPLPTVELPFISHFSRVVRDPGWDAISGLAVLGTEALPLGDNTDPWNSIATDTGLSAGSNRFWIQCHL